MLYDIADRKYVFKFSPLKGFDSTEIFLYHFLNILNIIGKENINIYTLQLQIQNAILSAKERYFVDTGKTIHVELNDIKFDNDSCILFLNISNKIIEVTI